MSYEVQEPHMSLREVERAILMEAAGCSDEDKKNLTYAVQNAPEVILHRQALAKKLLKVFLVNIGFDPSVRNKYGVENKHNWDAERAKIDPDDDNYDRKMARIDREESEEEAALAATDHQAWAMIHKWEDIIARRAYALEKLDLVDCDLGGMAPNDVTIPFPDTMDTPWEGTIKITREGLKFLCSGKTLVERRGQSNVDPLDREVEVEQDRKKGILSRIFG